MEGWKEGGEGENLPIGPKLSYEGDVGLRNLRIMRPES